MSLTEGELLEIVPELEKLSTEVELCKHKAYMTTSRPGYIRCLLCGHEIFDRRRKA